MNNQVFCTFHSTRYSLH